MGGLLPYILLVMLPSIAITGWAAWRVRSTYAKWSKIDSGIPLTHSILPAGCSTGRG